MSNTEFVFPDEVEVPAVEKDTVDSEIEIEIVDDTPVKDRGRKPLEREVEDPSDDEMDTYSEGVKKRIKELTHARHDERRAKETLAREKNELERITQHMAAENKRLKQYVSTGEHTYAETIKAATSAELEKAKRAYKALTRRGTLTGW